MDRIEVDIDSVVTGLGRVLIPRGLAKRILVNLAQTTRTRQKPLRGKKLSTYPRLRYRKLFGVLLMTAGAFAQALPEPGSHAPDFTLLSQLGSRVSLEAYKGSWVVLFFLGDHSSSDVAVYARNLQRDTAKYASYNAYVIGIGRTSAESNGDWAKTNGVVFPLLSDPDQKIAGAYGVPAQASNGALDGGIYEVIIAPDGTVRLPGIVTSDVDGQSDHLLACLQYFADQRR